MAKQIDMQAFTMGNPDEFKQVVEMYKAELLYFACKLTNNKPEAEDIVQESFEALFINHKSFEAPAAIRAFLYTVARNKSLNYLTSENCHARHEDIIRRQSNDIQEAVALNAMIWTEFMKGLHEAIEKLPRIRRKVFELHKEGKSNAEIAAILNMSRDNVRNHIFNARKKLHKLM